MSDDENIGTTLAYTKSPKTSKRTSFQDELKKVVSARKSRHPTITESDDSDYSDEFEEIDDDDVFKNLFTKKSTNESTKRTISNNFLLPDDEDEPQKVSFLKSKKLIGSYEENEWDHKNNENKLPSKQDRRPEGGEQKSSFFSEHQKYNKSIIQDEGDAKPVPIPKPREYKIKSSQSEEGIALSASDESFKPTPLQRSVLRRSNHVEESRIDERSSGSRPSSSLSAPSSMTKLNVRSTENIALLETFSSEGQNQSSPPPPTPKPRPSFAEDNLGGSVLPVSPEGTFPFTKEPSELEQQGISQPKDDDRRSPSVLELMMATVYEQSKQQLIETPPLENIDCETRMAHKSRQKVEYDSFNSSGHDAENRNTAEQQRHKAIQEKNLKNKEETSDRVNSPSTGCLNAALQHMKNHSSVRNSTYKTAKSRYLGTLSVLDKQLLKGASDPEAADTLRAAVYQDWLEKKRIFLQELQKIKKMEEEKEKEKRRLEGGAKKEEASASFQAWKAVKTKELKKTIMKLKEEEEKKRKEFEQMAEKKEESKKAFEKWKEDKEEHLKEKIRKEKQAEMAKKRKEEQAVAEKKEESKMAFSKWSEKKEDVLKSKKKEKLQEEKEKLEKERAEKEWQEKKAMEEYERWLEKKERNDKIVKKQKKLQVILEEEPIPPWSPPGRTVPMGK